MPGEFLAMPCRLLCSSCAKPIVFTSFKEITPAGRLLAMCVNEACTQVNIVYRYDIPRVPVYTIAVAPQGETS